MLFYDMFCSVLFHYVSPHHISASSLFLSCIAHSVQSSIISIYHLVSLFPISSSFPPFSLSRTTSTPYLDSRSIQFHSIALILERKTCLALSRLAPSCFIIMPHLALPCIILYCLVLSCHVMSCNAMYYHTTLSTHFTGTIFSSRHGQHGTHTAPCPAHVILRSCSIPLTTS